MLIVALTGGIGSGKSTVASIFADLGALVVDSDQLARDVLERGSDGFNQVVSEFGDEVLANGQIDRKALGRVVFNNPSLRLKLESITHPLIRKSFADFIAAAPKSSIIINQIPLLVESDHDYKFDAVITVSTSIELRNARLLQRGLSEQEISARIAAQASDLEREAIADFVIENNLELGDLTGEVEKIWQKLQLLNQSN
jgi:dephospho-CoA kinase